MARLSWERRGGFAALLTSCESATFLEMNAPEESVNTEAARKPLRYLMIGGFLGSGKTTAVAKLAKWLSEQGLRVGLITNDQGRDLVDTTVLGFQGFAMEEIRGGCFCCQFDALLDAAGKLDSRGADVLIAEPVGSCTDLVATVTFPLQKLYGANFRVAPVSVLVDPVRGFRAFGLQGGGTFSKDIIYIYKKQLEEADIIVISKCDLLGEQQLGALRDAIRAEFPAKEVLAVSAREGVNLEQWFRKICDGEQPKGKAMDVDYSVYGDGEAALGWLNSTVQLSAHQPFDGNQFLRSFVGEVQALLRSECVEVAHVKVTLRPGNAGLGAISLVRSDAEPEVSMRLQEPVEKGQLTINLRAEAEPLLLARAVRAGLAASAGRVASLKATVEHFEHFRPGKPIPTHRFETAAE